MKDEKYKFNLVLKPIFNMFKNYFAEFAKDTLTNEDLHKMFASTLKATIIKSY